MPRYIYSALWPECGASPGESDAGCVSVTSSNHKPTETAALVGCLSFVLIFVIADSFDIAGHGQ